MDGTPGQDGTEAPPAPRAARRGRALAITLAVMAAAVLLVRGALPLGVRLLLERQGSQALGLPVRIGEVDLALLRGGVALRDVRVGPGAAAGPLAELTWRRLSARLRWEELRRGRIWLDELVLDAPGVELLAAADAEPETQPEPTPEPKGDDPDHAARSGTSEADADGEDGTWPLRIESLRITRASLRAVLRADVREPLRLEIRELVAGPISLEGRTASVEDVTLRGGGLRLARVLLAPTSGVDTRVEAASAEPAPSWRWRIGRLSLEPAEIELLGDETERLELRGVVQQASSEPGARFPLEAQLTLGSGVVALDGRAGLSPAAFDGALRWSDLELTRVFALALPELAPRLQRGRSEGELQVTAAAPGEAGAGPPAAQAEGSLRIEDLAWQEADPGGLSFQSQSIELAVEALRVPGAGEPAPAASLTLRRLHAVAPALSLTRLPDDGAAAAPAQAPSGTGVALRIAALDVERGRLSLEDRSVEPFYRGGLEALTLAARDLRWPGANIGSLQVRARTQERGSLTLEGALQDGAGELRLELERVALPELNPYAMRWLDYRVDRGSASLRTRLALGSQATEADNRLVLHDLRLGSGAAEHFLAQFGVPLQLGLALLRDASGDITLEIPVRVDRKGAGVSAGPVVTSALRQALLSALTSPLRVIGSVVVQGEEVASYAPEPIPFERGGEEPTPAGRERLERLAGVLASHPQLAVGLAGRAGAVDRDALADAALFEALRAGEAPPPVTSGEDALAATLLEALRARASGLEAVLTSAQKALLARWRAGVDIPAPRLLELAAHRARDARSALAEDHGVPVERILLRETGIGEPAGVVVDLDAAED